MPAIALLLVVTVGLSAGPSGAQQGGAAASLAASGEGWWNLLSSRPETGMGALVPAPSTPAPDVPDGSIAVSMRFGQVDKVAAIGVVLTAPTGSEVTAATLTLVEVDSGTAQLRPEEATIVACPITSFFVPKSNGDLADAPEADCEAARSEGVRNDDGTWTFDIAPIVALWLDGTIAANGLRFDPAGGAGETFQVAFTGEEDAAFTADITAGAAEEDPFALDTATPAPAPGGGFGGSVDAGGSFSSPPTPAPAVETPAAEPPPTTAPALRPQPALSAEPASNQAGETFGNWSWWIPLAIVAAVLLALLSSWYLGRRDAAQPVTRPQRGVSRALARRRPVQLEIS